MRYMISRCSDQGRARMRGKIRDGGETETEADFETEVQTITQDSIG